MRGSDEKLCLSEKERCNVWKDYMERIMNEEIIGNPVVCVSREEVLQALNEMKTGKAPGPSEVSQELIAASRGVGILLMAEICPRIQYGFGIPAELALRIVVPIFTVKGYIRNCSCNRTVKLRENDIKVVKSVLENRLCRTVSVDENQFDN